MKIVPHVANEVLELVKEYPNEKIIIVNELKEHNQYVNAVNILVLDKLGYIGELVGLVDDYTPLHEVDNVHIS